MAMSDEQKDLLEKLGLPTDFSGLSDDQYLDAEDMLGDEMQTRGINANGDGLNDYGKLCRSVIIAMQAD